jgi:hypothetical protein
LTCRTRKRHRRHEEAKAAKKKGIGAWYVGDDAPDNMSTTLLDSLVCYMKDTLLRALGFGTSGVGAVPPEYPRKPELVLTPIAGSLKAAYVPDSGEPAPECTCRTLAPVSLVIAAARPTIIDLWPRPPVITE